MKTSDFSLSTLALLAALGSAAPAPSLQVNDQAEQSSVRVPRYRNNNAPPANGTRALMKTYRKFGWSFPWSDLPLFGSSAWGSSGSSQSSGTTAGLGGSTGQVNAQAESNDSEYICPVTVGNQLLNLDFDTGSSDLWVFSTLLPTSQDTGHTLYNPQKSSSFQQMQGYTWQISYGDGSGAQGTVGTDSVTIGGVTVRDQAVELANQVSQEFLSDQQSDGLVGLAFQSINDVQPTPQKTFFENAIPNLALPVFAANLENDGSGYYEFGAVDETAYEGPLASVPIDNSKGYWQFDSTTYGIGGQTFTNFNSSPGIADTGTSLLVLDSAVASAYWSKVPSSSNSAQYGGYVFPCKDAASLPSFSFAVGSNYVVTIPPALLNYANADSDTCFGAIQSNANAGMQIFGDVFFRAAFVVFENSDAFTGLHVAKKTITAAEPAQSS